MKDIIHLLWALVGAIVGFVVGLLAYFGIYNIFTDRLTRSGNLSLIVIIVLAGGGMVGGGWLTLWIMARVDKSRRQKEREARRKFGTKRRK